jgi:superfamily II DNA/RNA helicase
VQTLRTLLKLKQRQERGGGGNTHGGWGSGGGGDSSKSKKAAALKQAMTKASGKGGRGKGKGGAADNGNEDSDEDSDEEDESGLRKRARSAVIFTGSCKRCQEVTQVLLELGVDAVCLHSLLDQRRRTASLGKFKSLGCRLLVATDVASRGLDIPDVDLVINYDMPRWGGVFKVVGGIGFGVNRRRC